MEYSEINTKLEALNLQKRIQWAKEYWANKKVLITTAFGLEGSVLVHILGLLWPDVNFANLDTGYQFEETQFVKRQLEMRYGINIKLVKPELNVKAYETKHGGPLYHNNPDQCCFDRKVTVLKKLLSNYDIWISAIRRDQSPARANTPIISHDDKFEVVKFCPLVDWRRKDTWAFIKKHHIPHSPLFEQGYTSVGCKPCTQMNFNPNNERAGRWIATSKTECGLHYPTKSKS